MDDLGPPVLGPAHNPLNLWTTWISASSRNVAFIPPEGVAALPASAGDTSKADSWALGCLTIWFINIDQPLELVRHMRYASGVEVFHLEQPLLPRLQALYAPTGQHKNMVIGPKIKLIRPVPSVCEDFLGHCLELDPAKRWSLQQLRAHPFLDLTKSTEELFTLEAELFKHRLSFKEVFELRNVRNHPVLKSDDAGLPHQQGELVQKLPGNRPPRMADIWRFALYGKEERELQEKRALWWKAFGQLVNALTMEASTEEWASICRRGLQEGSKNIVQHFGRQLVEARHLAFPMEIHVVTEHCTGGSFKDAAEYALPIDIVAKWSREVLQGLKYLYGHRIVHRNINSSIILFSEVGFKGIIKIGGFQYMRQLEKDRTECHEVSARPGQDGRFAAPEIVNSYTGDVNVGRKCDIWSLGCVVLHLLSGEPPLYTGAKDQPMLTEMAILYQLNSANKKLPQIHDWIPIKAREFVRTCLKFDPEERLAAAELLQNLENESLGQDTPVYLANRKGEQLPVDVVLHWRN
ncbi:uncharacterized protein LOC129597487 [Paramacrobiotus metropolitanus]|uniref:uncharacterized protein LOC129597487 n=1 Tax=Paramacrobiotus metropolitanus TaxID=2943436 RepID=UPI00244563F7|nr:uncharacterized protein LOC129597487 [Paramacrobiotus metropolitanus]